MSIAQTSYFYNSPGDPLLLGIVGAGKFFGVIRRFRVSDRLIYKPDAQALSRSRIHYPHRKSSCTQRHRGGNDSIPLNDEKTSQRLRRAAAR